MASSVYRDNNGSFSGSDVEDLKDDANDLEAAAGPPPPPTAPFSEQTNVIIQIVIQVFISGTVSLFGLVSNVVNIVMFYRQGIMTHSSLVNLTSLSVSDFFCCFFGVMGAVYGVMLHFFDTSGWSWDVRSFYVCTTGRPSNTFTQITSWLTVLLTFERAFSVVFPFKVKYIFAPKRTFVIIIFIFVLTFITNGPTMLQRHPELIFNPSTNRTILFYVQNHLNTVLLDRMFFYTCLTTFRFLSVVIVVLCNFIIFWKVYLSQKFRKVSTPSKQSKPQDQQSGSRDQATNESRTTNVTKYESSETNNKQQPSSTQNNQKNTQAQNKSTNKEIQLLRMITLISIVFTVSYMLTVVHVVLFYIVWTWNVDYHWWVDVVFWNVVSCMQLISASTNIFIYATLSTRYRQELFLCLGKKHE